MQPIKEDEETTDVLTVLRPLKGIDQSKYQPIIRTLPQVKINLSPYKDHVPLKEILRKSESDLVDQVVNFNASKVKKIAQVADREVQVTQSLQAELNMESGLNDSPT